MSFVAETVTRRLATAASAVPRAVAATAPRAFTTQAPLQKTATEAAKDTLKSVDRAVSDKIVDGISMGQTVSQKLKEAGVDITSGKASGQAEQLRAEASGKAAEVSGEAKGAAHETAGKAKGAFEEAKGKVKGAAEEAKRKL